MIAVVTGWRYHWRRYLGLLPIQWCTVCGGPYWGGWPRFGREPWRPSWKDYCSRECADNEFESVARLQSLASPRAPLTQPRPLSRERNLMSKPIRVAYSTLTDRFFAFSKYRSETRGGREIITVTGEKYDVTRDIARAVVENRIEFSRSEPPAP